MSCKKFCYYRKTRLTEDSMCLTPALEIFTRAHRLLKNFMNLYKIHEGKCCGINYDAVPLHGALDIVAAVMTSMVCGNVLKKGSQRSGLFRSMFPCVPCQDTEALPEEIVRKVDAIMTCLERCCAIENITCRIKDVLCILERLAPCAMSEKFQTLSLLLKEIMRKLICCGQDLEEPFGNTQTKLILNLVNNFIRDWSEKRSGSRACLRICRFCDRAVSETTRQWGTFCCDEAKRFHDIRIEWVLRQSISDASEDEAIDRRPKWKSSRNERFDDDSRTRASLEISRPVDVTDYDDSGARFDERTSAKEKLESGDRTIEHRSDGETSETRRAEAEVFSKKTKMERYDDSSRQWDKFDRVEGRDLTKTAAGTSEGKTRGKIKRSRDIDRTGEYPIGPDGREERDDVPYKSKLDKIRGSRGLRDTNEERAAAGKTRKIKRDAKYLSQRRLEYTEFSEMESEATGVRRSRKGDKGVSVIAENSPKERRKKKLRRDTLAENERKKMVEKMTDADVGERATGRRDRKKPRTEENIEVDETTDTSGRKEADNRRRRKKADAFDSGKKAVSYTLDEKDKVFQPDGTRDGRSSNERDETESNSTKRRRDVKRGASSAEDKSTLDSESRNKKETSKSSKKERRRSGSDGTEDDYSMTYGSRYQKKRAIPPKFNDVQIDDRSPIEYQLSNQHFAKLGWTVLPVAKIMRKIIQYRAKPSKPRLDWFEKHKLAGRTYYDDEARIFVNFHSDGSAEVFYPNGATAVKLQRPQNRKCLSLNQGEALEMARQSKTKNVVTIAITIDVSPSSPGGKDCMGVERGSQIVAVFDTVGNGAVFNEDGATRLSYNQIGGIWRDNPTGVPLAWKWDACEKESITKIVYTEKSARRIEKLFDLAESRILKSSGSAKASTSPASPRNKEKKVERLKPVVQEHDDDDEEEEEVESGQIGPDDTYHFRPIHLKVNDYIGLKIFNRTNIALRFLAGKKSIRIQLGTILNLNEEVGSYFVDTSLKHGTLKCKFEELVPSRLKLDSSMDDIAEKIQKVRRSARYRELTMAKYRPLLRVWKMSGTRCRPR